MDTLQEDICKFMVVSRWIIHGMRNISDKGVETSLWIKPTDAPNSNFIGITTRHVSGSLFARHQEFLAIHQRWYILCSCDRLLPGVGWNCSSILLLVANCSSQLHKMYQRRCMAKNSWWWAERLPETCRVVIPIKLEIIHLLVLFTRNLLRCTVIRS
jgi:hypothetical protein